MKFAINYSPAAANLVKSGDIMVDLFKTPDWDWIVDEALELKPVYVHFTLEAGNRSLGMVDWGAVQALAQKTGTKHINLHIDPRGDYYPDLPVDTIEAADVDRVFKVLISDVEEAARRFGSEHVILENSPYHAEPGNTLRLCVEPDLIRRLVEESGCGLLLDISHAIITATYLGMAPDEYISLLPVHKVRELHFAGIHWNSAKGRWQDHLSIQEEDWHWLEWALGQVQSGAWSAPWVLAFEYGGVGERFEWRSNPEVIAEQVPQIYELVKQLAS